MGKKKISLIDQIILDGKVLHELSNEEVVELYRDKDVSPAVYSVIQEEYISRMTTKKGQE